MKRNLEVLSLILLLVGIELATGSLTHALGDSSGSTELSEWGMSPRCP